MIRKITFMLAGVCAALFGVGCSEQATLADGADGTGTLRMQITATRAEMADYDPLDHLRVRIYNHKGQLVRKYTSVDEATAELQLLAGEYRVSIEAGETDKTPLKGAASFTRRMYKGEKRFTVTAGQQTQVEVVCNLLSTAVEVVFDKSVTKHLAEGFDVRVAADAAFDEEHILSGTVPALQYFESATGYFDLLESQTTLAWRFRGEHPARGVVEKTGLVPDIKQPGKYTLTFTYSDDLPGFIDCVGIRVDTTTDDQDDTIVFSPDPTIEGDGFDIAQTQKYISGEKRFNISTVKEMTSATLTFGERHVDLMALAAQTPASRADASTAEGVAAELLDAKTMTVTLSDAFFAGSMGGDHALSFHVTDAKGGEATTAATFRLQGIVPVTEQDYDMWNRSAVLRAQVFDAAAHTVNFYLNGTEVFPTADADGMHTLLIVPEWSEQRTNSANLAYYEMAPNTGLAPGTTYEWKMTLDGVDHTTTFTTAAGQTIPDGDMENSALECFKIEASGDSPFWASGNNSFAKTLCAQTTFNGMGGAYCAKLASSAPPLVGLAAGNLFSGLFYKDGLTTGVVEFGQAYQWQVRPAALRVKYYAKVGTINNDKGYDGPPLKNGDQDNARIFACIVDWNGRHKVTSGTSAPTGPWDPTTQTSTDEGKIIGYASLFIDRSSETDAMTSAELRFHYYDKETKPSGKYSLVISCSANAYGDFMLGCTTNELYVDDFEWVY